MTLWPVWDAYRKLWRYAQEVPPAAGAPVPRWMKEMPPPSYAQVLTVLDHLMSDAMAAAPWGISDNLYRTYCFLFVQWQRISYPLGPFYDEATQRWRNLRWLPLRAYAGNATGAVKVWQQWRTDVTHWSLEQVQQRYPLLPEPGRADLSAVGSQPMILASIVGGPKDTTLARVRAARPATGWHPWVTLARPELYHARLLPGLSRTLLSLIESSERWRCFVGALPQLVPDAAGTKFPLLRATLLSYFDDFAHTWSGPTQQVWRRRRRLLLPGTAQPLAGSLTEQGVWHANFLE